MAINNVATETVNGSVPVHRPNDTNEALELKDAAGCHGNRSNRVGGFA